MIWRGGNKKEESNCGMLELKHQKEENTYGNNTKNGTSIGSNYRNNCDYTIICTGLPPE